MLQNTIVGKFIRIIKPDLLKEISQAIKVPLTLISGTIDSVSLSIPWEALFTTKKD